MTLHCCGRRHHQVSQEYRGRRHYQGSQESSNNANSSTHVKVQNLTNQKGMDIATLLEEAVRSSNISGSGEDFCHNYCVSLGLDNESSKIKISMGLVFKHITGLVQIW